MKIVLFLLAILMTPLSCKINQSPPAMEWLGYDESAMIAQNEDHKIERMRYKLIQSRFLDVNSIWATIQPQLKGFSDQDYQRLYPLIYERNITEIQRSIETGQMSYVQLVQWYLYRIMKYENDPETTLHSIISINPLAVEEAMKRDAERKLGAHPIYGMPILLKDNINTRDMPTTAGAAVLANNQTEDAHIVKRIKSNGGIILGKVNLSEWAYFFCGGCPVGYSAIGGQTLNPYGRRELETGGSSSGSGVTMAANYAVGAVGTETSGSILSPSSQNSIVGLKPTIGRLSRSGIVPISSTLDTPGPMTRNVTDNAILLSAMLGIDHHDAITESAPAVLPYHADLTSTTLDDVVLGANVDLIDSDSMYRSMIDQLRDDGVNVISFTPPEVDLPDFLTLLEADMRRDLPSYLKDHAGADVTIKNTRDVVDYNLQDTTLRAPYGQARLEGVIADTTTNVQLQDIQDKLMSSSRKYYDAIKKKHSIDVILSINNRDAGLAAVAKYPALTLPMGYKTSGEPINLTLIGEPFGEHLLLQLAYDFESRYSLRVPPKDYVE